MCHSSAGFEDKLRIKAKFMGRERLAKTFASSVRAAKVKYHIETLVANWQITGAFAPSLLHRSASHSA